MKHLLTVLACLLILPAFAQEDDGYIMYQSILLTAKDGHAQQLTQGVKAHNEKFHTEGAQSVNVWQINSGPRAGSMFWVKGPLTWTDMDTPLDTDGHMDDWWANVTPHAHMGEWNWWRLMDDMNYVPDGFEAGVAVVRYFDIKEDKWNNAVHIWETIFKLYRENNWDMALQIYTNQANSGNDWDWAIMWHHTNWASMDKNRGFFGKYEEMYGIDRDEFFEGWNEASEFMGMEIISLRKDLSVLDNDQGND